VYGQTATGNAAPLRTIQGGATGLSGPEGVAVDLVNNELFVANFGANSITIYSRTATGNVAPLRTITGGATGLSDPWGLAVDLVDDELFVVNTVGSVTVYSRTASGNVAPLRTLSGGGTGLDFPLFIALSATSSSPIPTLSEWVQLLMVGLLVAGGLWALRRRGGPRLHSRLG
jgi:DNA-binding beta-propeller fold protein YncE